jgi:hypothetical protein
VDVERAREIHDAARREYEKKMASI